jgi:hypothetical protein
MDSHSAHILRIPGISSGKRPPGPDFINVRLSNDFKAANRTSFLNTRDAASAFAIEAGHPGAPRLRRSANQVPGIPSGACAPVLPSQPEYRGGTQPDLQQSDDVLPSRLIREVCGRGIGQPKLAGKFPSIDLRAWIASVLQLRSET